MKHTCRACAADFRSVRSDARYCSAKCRQRAARARKVNAGVSSPIDGYRYTDNQPFDSYRYQAEEQPFDHRGYVSSNILDAEAAWKKRRGGKDRIIHSTTEKR